MTDHPITPLPELVEEWRMDYMGRGHAFIYVATRAVQWGADQELEACLDWLDDTDCEDPQEVAQRLRAARRPKSPSLKEQALEQLCEVNAMLQFHTTGGETSIIRRALEALDD